jgi:UMP-CMP kinase
LPRGQGDEHDAVRRVEVRPHDRCGLPETPRALNPRATFGIDRRFPPLRPSLPRSTAAPGGTSYDNDEAFIDAFATLRARENLETYDASFATYRAIEADVRREGRVPPLAKSKPRPRPANKVVLVLGAPGTDKEWHCANLARDYGFTRISAADMLREEVEAEMSGLDAWEMWKSTIAAGEWLHSTDATLRMISSAMARAGPNAKFLIDWFPRDLDQVKEFHERVCAVDFVLFLDVEPPPETGVDGGPDDPEDAERKRFEAFAEKHRACLNHYASEGMVHRVRSPGDRAHVTIYGDRSAMTGPVAREFYRGERLPRDAWTAKDRSDWTWHAPERALIRFDYEADQTYANVRVVMRKENIEPKPMEEETLTSPERRMVRFMQASARNYVKRMEFEKTVGDRVDRLVREMEDA